MDREEIKKLDIQNNEVENRFELMLPEGKGLVEYEQRGDKFFLMHTEIPKSLQGMGLGSIFVTKVLEYMRAHNFKVVPFCPYIKTYLKRHPEFDDLR